MESRAAAWQTHGRAASDFRIEEVKPFTVKRVVTQLKGRLVAHNVVEPSGEVNVADGVEDGGPWC
jgi:hypothetical protein